MPTKVIMPQLGETVIEGTVGRWLIGEGQPVKEYDPLLTVTTDKVDTEIPAPASGIVLKILVAEGQTVAAGTLLAIIGQPGEVGGQSPASPSAERAAREDQPANGERQPGVTPLAQRIAGENGVDLRQVRGTGPAGRISKEDVEAHLAARPAETGLRRTGGRKGFISPAVARLAEEFDVDLSQVVGTGEGGRITRKDIQVYIAAPVPPEIRTTASRETAVSQTGAVSEPELPAWEQPGTGSLFKPTEEMGPPAADGTQTAGQAAGAERDTETAPLTAMRRSIAKHMILSRQTSAHVTTVMEADMTQVVRARERQRGEFERQGTRLTFTPFLLQAVVAGLRAMPEANSTLQGDSLLLHRRIHIGLAVAIAEGLIVPVVRDADEKSLLGLARAVNDLAERARAKRLAPEEVQGATFTLTNHGTSGSLLATPIINQPQAGILGVGAIQKRPVVINRSNTLLPDAEDYLQIRPMVYLSFSFDHRILDGAEADHFLATVVQFLEHYSA